MILSWYSHWYNHWYFRANPALGWCVLYIFTIW